MSAPARLNYTVLGSSEVTAFEVNDEGILVQNVLREIYADLTDPDKGPGYQFWLVWGSATLD